MIGQLKIWFRLTIEDINFRIREMVRRTIRKLVEIAITDLDLMGSLQDIASSTAFERKYLSQAADFKSRSQLFKFVVEQVRDDSGLFLEFGVYKGDSINRLAALRPGVRWYGFDSFVGLPQAWTMGARTGAFSIGGKLPSVRDNVTLIEGFFEQSLPPFAAEHRGSKIALLHVDCDLYSATRTIFAELGDMLQAGSIVIFDEFINYAGWQDGEYKAFCEFVRERNRTFEYIGYVRTGGQVAIRMT
jgi:Methyltransferase domain